MPVDAYGIALVVERELARNPSYQELTLHLWGPAAALARAMNLLPIVASRNVVKIRYNQYTRLLHIGAPHDDVFKSRQLRAVKRVWPLCLDTRHDARDALNGEPRTFMALVNSHKWLIVKIEATPPIFQSPDSAYRRIVP